VRHLGLGQPRRQRQKARASWSQTAPTPIEPCGRTQSAGRPRSPSDARPIPRIVDATSPSRSLTTHGGRRDDPKKQVLSYGLRARRPKPPSPWRQSKVRLGHPIKLTLGLETPRGKRLHAGRAHDSRFIHQGGRKPMRTHPPAAPRFRLLSAQSLRRGTAAKRSPPAS
jgi:hypothetical protein